jgi:hypothetical protein
MGVTSPISAKGIDPKLFKQFKADLEVILNWVTQEELGKHMRVQRSNINRYIKGNLPITKGFLKRFYTSWGDVVNEKSAQLREESPSYPTQGQKQEPTLTEILAILIRIESKIDSQTR